MKKLITINGLFLIFINLTVAQVSVTVGSLSVSSADIGSVVNIPVTVVNGYTNVGSIQLAFNFDSSVLTPVYQNSTNSGLVSPSALTTNNGGSWMSGTGTSGNVSSNWYDPLFNGVNIPNNTVLYHLQFTYNGGNSTITANTSACFFYDSNYNSIQLTFTNGNVNYNNLTVSISNVNLTSSNINSTINIPVTAEYGYNHVGSMQFTFNFNSTVLTPITISSTNPGVINPCSQTTANGGTWISGNGTNNQLVVTWYDPTFNGVTIPNGTVLFELSFTYHGGSCALSFTNSNSYVFDALYQPVTINYNSGVVNGIDIQNINLISGWSIMSTYINPANPDISSVFQPVVSSLVIVKNTSGQVFWPVYNINQIGNLALGQGYQLKMTQAQTLPVYGNAVVPENSPFSIANGWSIIGYLRQSQGAVDVIFSSVISNIYLIKNYSGLVYWPIYNLNQIVNLVPGQGYQMRTTTSFTYSYPANSENISKSSISQMNQVHFPVIQPNATNMTLGIPKNVVADFLNIGDEVAIFSKNGLLVGSSIYSGENMAITLWGNDDLENQTNGLVEGEEFQIKFWNKETNQESEIVVISWLEGNGIFEANTVSIIDNLKFGELNVSTSRLLQNYPNPCVEHTIIDFVIGNETDVTLLVQNTLGETVKTLVNNHYDEGKYSIEFNTSDLAIGNYYITLKTSDFQQTKVLTVK